MISIPKQTIQNNNNLLTFQEVLDSVQLNTLFDMEDDEDPNGDIIKRWDNIEHGEYITIELTIDNYLTIIGKDIDYFEGYIK